MAQATSTRHAPKARPTIVVATTGTTSRFRTRSLAKKPSGSSHPSGSPGSLAEEPRHRAPLRRQQGHLEIDAEQAEHDERVEHRQRVGTRHGHRSRSRDRRAP